MIFISPFSLDTVSFVDGPLVPASSPKAPAYYPHAMTLFCKRYTFTPFISLVDPLFYAPKTNFCRVLLIWRYFPYSLSLSLYGDCCWIFFFFLIQAVDAHWHLICGGVSKRLLLLPGAELPSWKFWPSQRPLSTSLDPGGRLSSFWSSFGRCPVWCYPPICTWVFLVIFWLEVSN